jgi:citrate synthase
MARKMSDKEGSIKSRIWNEVPSADNPFSADICLLHGFDVYGDLLVKISWPEYMYLLLTGEPPTSEQTKLMESISIALANPGIRDHSVRAAMNGAAGGSGNAACLMAALAVGAGNLGGAREIFIAMNYWSSCGTDLDAWKQNLQQPPNEERADVWPELEHPPGFDPNGISCALPVIQTLNCLEKFNVGGALSWLKKHRESLEIISQCPLAMSGVAAAVFYDLELTAEQGEMLYLLLRLPGAAVHALEQQSYGWRKYPFWKNGLELTNDPGQPESNIKT